MKRLTCILILLSLSLPCWGETTVYSTRWYDSADGTYLYPDNATGFKVYDNGNFSVSPDTDATVYLGRAVIGSPASDFATISHYDCYTSTNFALRQGSTGNTVLNAASGRTVQVTIGNSTVGMTIDSSGNSSFGTSSPWSKLSVEGGDISDRDPTDLGSEHLTNGALTSGTSWSVTGGGSLSSNVCTFTDASGTLTQALVDMPAIGIGPANRMYVLSYTVSGVTGTPTATITTAFASAATSLTITNGAKTVYFKAAAAPTAFVISATLTAGQAFTLDSLSLKQMGGDIMACGWFSGGGQSGIKIDGSGNVGISTATFPTGTMGKVLVLGDNAGDPTMGTGTAGLYNSGGEMYAIDAGSNKTLLTNDYEDRVDLDYVKDPLGNIPAANIKRNSYLGIEQRIDLLKLAYLVEKLTGEKLVTVTQVEKLDWDVEQARRENARDSEIASAQARAVELPQIIASIDAEIAAIEATAEDAKGDAKLSESLREQIAERKRTLDQFKAEQAKLVVPETYTAEAKPKWMSDIKAKATQIKTMEVK